MTSSLLGRLDIDPSTGAARSKRQIAPSKRLSNATPCCEGPTSERSASSCLASHSSGYDCSVIVDRFEPIVSKRKGALFDPEFAQGDESRVSSTRIRVNSPFLLSEIVHKGVTRLDGTV